MAASDHDNPFIKRAGPAARAERRVFWCFRLATYFVLLCGLSVFATIFVKGAGTLFRTEFPFVNTTFLTKAPETLHVFSFEGGEHEM
ncbi:MAG: phosphate ABC transporter, permease protein PstA, partial [Opitutaceae bacterium]|nr:phosphate ABC transporter, permease protein PstA [Opitutaceae bacterium]